MTQPPTITPQQNQTTDLAPFNIIRTETVLSRLPIHNLAKKGSVNVKITRKNEQGKIDLYWEVSPNPTFGAPGQLAYKLDTLVINKKFDELGRPLPKVVRLNHLRDIAKELDLGANTNKTKKVSLQNAAAFITAKLHYKAKDGTEKTLEAGFTRYSVIFTGERLPDGRKADAVYLVLNDIYLDVLNNAPTRPLDYEYLKQLTPGAQRLYEIISYKIFAALKNQFPHAELLYSEYCTFAAQQRYTDYDHFKKQMYKVHKPHKQSGYIEKVWYESTTDQDGKPDWTMCYVPGPKAIAEYTAFNHTKPIPTKTATNGSAEQGSRGVVTPSPETAPVESHSHNGTTAHQAPSPNGHHTPKSRGDQTPPDPHVSTAPDRGVTPVIPPVTTADDNPLAAQAKELLNHFYQTFHGVDTPTLSETALTKALAQATTLIARHGMDQAQHIIDYSHTAAQETNFKPAAFGATLQYETRAMADYEKTQLREKQNTALAQCQFCDKNGFLTFQEPNKPPFATKCSHDPERIHAFIQSKGVQLLRVS
jgi:hypothetical protein